MIRLILNTTCSKDQHDIPDSSRRRASRKHLRNDSQKLVQRRRSNQDSHNLPKPPRPIIDLIQTKPIQLVGEDGKSVQVYENEDRGECRDDISPEPVCDCGQTSEWVSFRHPEAGPEE